MSYEYSENVLIQNSAGNVLEKKLGWEVVYAYNSEKLGENGTLGRTSYHEIVLKRYLRQALLKNNDWLTEEECTAAIKTLCAYTASATLMQINEEKYKLLRDGIPVQCKKPDGTFETRTAKIFDFEHPEENHFLAVKEMKIHGDLYRRRTDIVGFVNGIPLLFVELKKQTVDVQDAYTCNYTDYLSTIPQLFHFNAFLMLSNGLEAKVGTLGSKYEFFHEWKRLQEDETGAVDLETMLLGICNKQNFMDLFENFILFDHSGGRTAKIFARNHQYLGVNEAMESYKARKLKEGKLGVFWHTQGSGKSYSMVFLAQKIRRKFAGSPTFLILTDRDELNKQISDTFEACGCLGSVKASKCIPSSGARLVEMLEGNPSYIFTLIQKFNQPDAKPIIPDHDIIILSDEGVSTVSLRRICVKCFRLLPVSVLQELRCSSMTTSRREPLVPISRCMIFSVLWTTVQLFRFTMRIAVICLISRIPKSMTNFLQQSKPQTLMSTNSQSLNWNLQRIYILSQHNHVWKRLQEILCLTIRSSGQRGRQCLSV